MSDQTSDRSDDPPAADSGDKGSEEKKSSRKKLIGGKVLAWTGGLVGTAVAAFIAAYATVLGTSAASPAPGSSPPGGNPVLVTVGNVVGDDLTVALPEPLVLGKAELRSLYAAVADPSSGYAAWLTAHHAAFVDRVHIQLVVQGNRHHPVRIINITPVEHCSAPLHGTMFFFPGQGVEPSAQLYLDLDKPFRPAGYAPVASPTRYPDYFGRYSVSLSYGDQFTFQVSASTGSQYCEFRLDLTLIDDGKTVIEPVDDHGQPFRLTSVTRRAQRTVFTGYQVLYVIWFAAGGRGATAAGPGTVPWVRGDPKTFSFAGPP